MSDKSPAKKAWETMRSKSPGIKAKYTKRRKQGAKQVAQKIKDKQWESEKIEYLLKLKEESNSNACVVCSESRSIVLQNHHVDPEGKTLVKLCANCHDVVRRGTLEDLKKAHGETGNEAKWTATSYNTA